MNFTILGGDIRYKFLYEMLVNSNNHVKVFNNFYLPQSSQSQTLQHSLIDTNTLICPIPLSKDEFSIFNPHFDKLSVESLIYHMKECNVNNIVAGAIHDSIRKKFEVNHIRYTDFFDDDQVAIMNAIPTAEGSIQIAMEESPRTIFDSNCLVLGYGRCGKILANMLNGLGANTSVTYRKSSDYAYIKAYGFRSIRLDDLENYISDFHFIFNTIPHLVIDKSKLKKVRDDVLILDLAQAPGGIDYASAEALKINALYCPGLPAKVAPYTSAKVIFDKLIF